MVSAMSHIDELDIVIRNKGAKVSAGIPQLALWATASDAHEAINALERKRAAFLADLAEAGGSMTLNHARIRCAPPRRPALNWPNSRSRG